MQTNELIDIIKKHLADRVLSAEAMKNEDVLVVVDRDHLASSLETLKNAPDLAFTTLMNHLGVDYGDRMAVIYNFYSPALQRKITVKTFLDREHPEVHSLEPVFPGISWYERETFDMFGIRFLGHGNLKRLLLPDDWDGHPLRKDYVYPEAYNGIQTGRINLLDEAFGAGEANV